VAPANSIWMLGTGAAHPQWAKRQPHGCCRDQGSPLKLIPPRQANSSTDYQDLHGKDQPCFRSVDPRQKGDELDNNTPLRTFLIFHFGTMQMAVIDARLTASYFGFPSPGWKEPLAPCMAEEKRAVKRGRLPSVI